MFGLRINLGIVDFSPSDLSPDLTDFPDSDGAPPDSRLAVLLRVVLLPDRVGLSS